MNGYATVGQPAAIAAVRAMLATRVPHAILLAGPASVGKLPLAMDLAAALLCTGAQGADRPCRTCRGCRMVEHGNHPDLHRLEPEGAGGQIRIGDRLHPEPGTVRGLAVELALLPVEGGARVAILRDAHRMNDDAQSALLKTLEEPPAGTTLILCADDEERLLPTVRSRCARIRLGPVGVRDIERLLAERELADPPTAARLARLAGGRAGLAVAYAAAPEAEAIRGEIGRVLLDLVGATRAVRLRSAKELLARAGSLASMADPQPVKAAPARRGRAAARGSAARGDSSTTAMVVADPAPTDTGGEAGAAADAEAEPERKASAAERRRTLGVLLDAWRGLARDLALAQLGAVRSIREIGLLEELQATAAIAPPDAFAAFLGRLARAGELVDANVSPELVLDVLLVRWPAAGRGVSVAANGR
jgi:DNA polymerase-3 subunit delta'